MSSLGIWSLALIAYQTLLCITFSWLILGCHFSPDKNDLHELTLIKFLYLYDPKACGRVYFYNVTSVNQKEEYGNIVWPLENGIAAAFRTKVQLWLYLHLTWLVFSVINVTQEFRVHRFYATMVPFTLAGVSLLVLDVVHAGIFLNDATYTSNEASIIKYVGSQGHVRYMNKLIILDRDMSSDTSWISLLLAFLSLRGIVQWVINFWVVKDNYFEGLKHFRIQQTQTKSKGNL